MIAKGLVFLIFLSLFTACAENSENESLITSSSVECTTRALPNSFIVHWKSGQISTIKAKSFADLKERFLSNLMENVEMIEPNYKIIVEPLNQLAVAGTEDPDWGPEAIKASWAWNQNYKGQNIIVAVIDSGVDITHPQLENNIHINVAEESGLPGVDDDGNGYIDDVNGWDFLNNKPLSGDELGHGTHVAGIISTDHSLGDALGIAPSAKVMPLDFIDQYGGTEADAVRAIHYALDNGAHVINASWGSAICSQAIENALKAAESANVFVAVAAGNESRNLSYSPMFPAIYNFENQITVGASTIEFYRAQFSNYGQPVHVVAPGEKILSTVPLSLDPLGYAFNSGTSMAAPFVAGLAALLLGEYPATSAKMLKDVITKTVTSGEFNVRFNGEIHVENAFLELEKSN